MKWPRIPSDFAWLNKASDGRTFPDFPATFCMRFAQRMCGSCSCVTLNAIPNMDYRGGEHEQTVRSCVKISICSGFLCRQILLRLGIILKAYFGAIEF